MKEKLRKTLVLFTFLIGSTMPGKFPSIRNQGKREQETKDIAMGLTLAL